MTDHSQADSGFDGPLPPWMAAFFLIVVVGGVADLIMDRPKSLWSVHVVFELALIVASLVFALILFRGWRRTARTLGAVRSSLAESEAARDAWRRQADDAISGFSRAIERQFDEWKLSRAERDVAYLLLRGEGHKQAAAILNRSERTVRQHAVEVYRKAGLQGRAELAAFFLQDLMPERVAASAAPERTDA